MWVTADLLAQQISRQASILLSGARAVSTLTTPTNGPLRTWMDDDIYITGTLAESMNWRNRMAKLTRGSAYIVP